MNPTPTPGATPWQTARTADAPTIWDTRHGPTDPDWAGQVVLPANPRMIVSAVATTIGTPAAGLAVWWAGGGLTGLMVTSIVGLAVTVAAASHRWDR